MILRILLNFLTAWSKFASRPALRDRLLKVWLVRTCNVNIALELVRHAEPTPDLLHQGLQLNRTLK